MQRSSSERKLNTACPNNNTEARQMTTNIQTSKQIFPTSGNAMAIEENSNADVRVSCNKGYDSGTGLIAPS